MALRLSPLLLVLLPLLAQAATDEADTKNASRITPLAAVKVVGERSSGDAGLQAWGAARAQDIPASLDVIGRQQIDARQIRSLSELAREDAALGDNYAPVGYYQNISIRGYPLDLGSGYRFNGLAMTGEQSIALEDKQQVEVLKGLAGSDAGVLEPGGVVNFVSKRPADVRTLTLGTDSHGSRSVAMDVGRWLSPNFGIRANLGGEDIHSYVRHADGHRTLLALATDWVPTAATRLELDVSDQHGAQRSVSGYQLLGGTRLPPHPDPTRMLGYQPWQQPVRIHSTNTAARLRHDLGDAWTLRVAAGRSRSAIDDNVVFAYGCYYVAACASLPGNHFGPNGEYDIYDYRSPDDTRLSDSARASLEGRFATGTLQHVLTLGADWRQRSITRRASVNEYVGSANIDGLDPPVYAPSPKQPGPRVRRLDSRQHTAFVLDRIVLGAHWQLLAGVQAAHLEETARDKHAAITRTTRLQRTLPQAALIFQPQPDLSLYASYSEGLALGKEAPFWTSNDGDMLGPRLSRQIESGVKYRWQGLDLAGALFRLWQPYQFARPDTSSAGYTFIEQGRETHAGLELSANGELRDGLRLEASLAWLRARASGTGIAAYEGHQLANVPALRGSVHLDYRLPWQPQVSVQVGGRYAASNPATADGSVRAPAYAVFDAGLRWQGQWAGRALTAQLGVDNLFNRVYWRDVGSAYGDTYLFPGAPRLARLSLRVDL